MASDKPRWTEPPGKAVNGQCKFPRGVRATISCTKTAREGGDAEGERAWRERCKLCWRAWPAGGRFGAPDALARPPRGERGLQASSVTARTAVVAANGKPVGVALTEGLGLAVPMHIHSLVRRKKQQHLSAATIARRLYGEALHHLGNRHDYCRRFDASKITTQGAQDALQARCFQFFDRCWQQIKRLIGAERMSPKPIGCLFTLESRPPNAHKPEWDVGAGSIRPCDLHSDLPIDCRCYATQRLQAPWRFRVRSCQQRRDAAQSQRLAHSRESGPAVVVAKRRLASSWHPATPVSSWKSRNPPEIQRLGEQHLPTHPKHGPFHLASGNRDLRTPTCR